MSTSRSPIAAAARAKRPAGCEIGECPVVDMTVDVERAALDAGSRGCPRGHDVNASRGRSLDCDSIRATFPQCSARGRDQSVYWKALRLAPTCMRNLCYKVRATCSDTIFRTRATHRPTVSFFTVRPSHSRPRRGVPLPMPQPPPGSVPNTFAHGED